MATKLTGAKIFEVEGIEIYVNRQPAKRGGRDRIWINLRQRKGEKVWRVAESLAYARAVDIQFEKA